MVCKSFTLPPFALLLVTCCLLACSAAAVHAQTTFTFNATGSDLSTSLSTNSGGSFESTVAGPYTGTYAGQPVSIFCTDATHDVNYGQSYQAIETTATSAASGTQTVGGTQYYTGGLSSAITGSDYGATNLNSVSAQARADEVSYLAYSFLNATSFTNQYSTDYLTNEAAVQVAIWDIVQDGGQDLSGAIQASVSGVPQTSLDNLVGFYEGKAAANNTFTSNNVQWIQAGTQSGHAQEFLTVLAPEPNLSVFILAMGLTLILFRLPKMQLQRSRSN